MSRSNYVLSATLEFKDKLTGGMKNAKTAISGVEQGMKSANVASASVAKSFAVTGASADTLTSKISGVKRSLDGIRGTKSVTLTARDSITPTIAKAKAELSALTSRAYTTTIYAKTEIGNRISGAGGAITGAVANGAMVAAGGFGVFKLAESAINAGESVYKLKDKLHVPASEAAYLSRMLGAADVDVNAFAKTMNNVDSKFSKNGKNMSDAQVMMQQYGIDLKDANGNLLPFTKQLDVLAEGYKKASEEGKDEEFVQQILGNRGMAMIPILENLAEAKEVASHIKGVGLDPNESHKAYISMKELTGETKQLGLAFAAAFLPVADEIIPKVTNEFQYLAGVFKDHQNELRKTASLVSKLVEAYAAIKIGKLGMNAVKSIGSIAKLPYDIYRKWGSTGGSKVTSTIGDVAKKDMAVNATNVIVNGKSVSSPATSGGPATTGGSIPGTAGGVAAGGVMGKIGRGAKMLGRFAAPIAVAAAGYNLYDAYDQNQAESDKYAGDDEETQKQVDYDNSQRTKTAVGGSIGGLAGMFAGAKLGALGGGAIGSAFGGIGAIPGAAIGGLVGGIGGAIGGEKFGEALGENWNQLSESSARAFDKISEQLSAKNAEWSDTFKATTDNLSNSWTGFKDWVNNGLNLISQTMSAKNAEWGETFNSFCETANQYIGNLGDWIGNTWNSISQGAESMGNDIKGAFNDAVSASESAWDGVVNWFNDNVWGPLKSNASNAWESIQSMASNIHMPSVGGSLSSNMSYMSEHSFATGTEFAPGGWSQINEHGGEIVDLPSGSRVYPAATTRKMLEKQLAGYGSTGAPSVTVTGNTFTVREDADIDKIAYKLARLISQGSINYGGGF